METTKHANLRLLSNKQSKAHIFNAPQRNIKRGEENENGN